MRNFFPQILHKKVRARICVRVFVNPRLFPPTNKLQGYFSEKVWTKKTKCIKEAVS